MYKLALIFILLPQLSLAEIRPYIGLEFSSITIQTSNLKDRIASLNKYDYAVSQLSQEPKINSSTNNFSLGLLLNDVERIELRPLHKSTQTHQSGKITPI